MTYDWPNAEIWLNIHCTCVKGEIDKVQGKKTSLRDRKMEWGNCQVRWIILRAHDNNKNAGTFYIHPRNLHCRVICWQLVSFRNISFSAIFYISHICVHLPKIACLQWFADQSIFVRSFYFSFLQSVYII